MFSKPPLPSRYPALPQPGLRRLLSSSSAAYRQRRESPGASLAPSPRWGRAARLRMLLAARAGGRTPRAGPLGLGRPAPDASHAAAGGRAPRRRRPGDPREMEAAAPAAAEAAGREELGACCARAAVLDDVARGRGMRRRAGPAVGLGGGGGCGRRPAASGGQGACH